MSSTLNDLDSFLKRIEPGIEAITGEEQDIASFMRLMRVFNEVGTEVAQSTARYLHMISVSDVIISLQLSQNFQPLSIHHVYGGVTFVG